MTVEQCFDYLVIDGGAIETDSDLLDYLVISAKSYTLVDIF